MTNTEMLDNEIKKEFDGLANMGQGSKEHAEAVDALCKLYSTRLQQEKSDLEAEKHEEEVKLSDRREANAEVYHEEELALKEAEAKSQRRHRLVDLLIKAGQAVGSVALGLIGVAVYDRVFTKSLVFEKTDTYTSYAGKNVINKMDKLLPKN